MAILGTLRLSTRRSHILSGLPALLSLAEPYLRGVSDFLVMNGDSFLEIDFRRLIQFHRGHDGLVSMAAQQVENAARFGTVQMDARGASS